MADLGDHIAMGVEEFEKPTVIQEFSRKNGCVGYVQLHRSQFRVEWAGRWIWLAMVVAFTGSSFKKSATCMHSSRFEVRIL